MVRFLVLISFLLLFSWPLIEKQVGNTDIEKTIDSVQSDINNIKDNPEVVNKINHMYKEAQQVMKQLDSQLEELLPSDMNHDI